jgi:hypothetical protein
MFLPPTAKAAGKTRPLRTVQMKAKDYRETIVLGLLVSQSWTTSVKQNARINSTGVSVPLMR